MFQKPRGAFVSGKISACGNHINHVVLGGIINRKTNNKSHKIHAPKNQGRVLFRKKKRLWQAHRPQGGWLEQSQSWKGGVAGRAARKVGFNSHGRWGGRVQPRGR